MPRPITATPVLKGKDAEVLRASLERVASPEEVARRQAAAKAFLARVRSGTRLTIPRADEMGTR